MGQGTFEGKYATQGKGYRHCIPRVDVSVGEKVRFALTLTLTFTLTLTRRRRCSAQCCSPTSSAAAAVHGAYREIQGDIGRYREIYGDIGRYMGRYRETQDELPGCALLYATRDLALTPRPDPQT